MQARSYRGIAPRANVRAGVSPGGCATITKDAAHLSEFRVRIPPELHRQLAMTAAEQGISLNRLASAKLAGEKPN